MTKTKGMYPVDINPQVPAFEQVLRCAKDRVGGNFASRRRRAFEIARARKAGC